MADLYFMKQSVVYQSDDAHQGAGAYVTHYKRLLDVVLVLILLPVVLPLVVCVWLVVRSDGGPGLFAQERIGFQGRPFRCFKIRSMVPSAPEQLECILSGDPALQSQWSAKRKLTPDPRVTRIGRFLRQTSLDELPQLWNVLRGEMSLVGPRPVPADELRKYAERRNIYEALRPGITGLWQVSGRNALSYQQRIELDERYLKYRSLRFDLLILWRTLKLVLSPNGI